MAKSLGGSSDEYGPYSVKETFDGGYIVSGATLSNDEDVSGYHGGSFYGDCWIVKLAGTATGISPSSDNLISLYPNPVQTQLNIDLPTPASEATIRVYDLQGKMFALPITLTNTQAQLNTTTLADGFYTVQIINNETGESEVGKFVKQK